MNQGSRLLLVPIAALWLSLAGCSSTSLTRTGQAQAPREQTCDFQILTAAPGAGFVEIGTVDYHYADVTAISSLETFKNRIRADVCKAGGDAVVALTDGYGNYKRATVLKATGPASQTREPQAGAAGGCQFDTQCKGTRICVKGECAEPPPKP